MPNSEASDREQSPSIAKSWSRLPPELHYEIFSRLASSFRYSFHPRQHQTDTKGACIRRLLTFERSRHDYNNGDQPPPYQRAVHIILCKQHPDFALFLGLSRRDTALINRALSGGGYAGSVQFCRFSTAWPGYNFRSNTFINALTAAIRFHCFAFASRFIIDTAEDYQDMITHESEDDSVEYSAGAASEAQNYSDNDSDSDRPSSSGSDYDLDSADDDDPDSESRSDSASHSDNDDEHSDISFGYDLEAFGWCTWGVGPDGKPMVSFSTDDRSRTPLLEFIQAVAIGPVAVHESTRLNMAQSLDDGRVLLNLLLTHYDTLPVINWKLPLYIDLNNVMIYASQPTVPVEYFTSIVNKVGHRILHYSHDLKYRFQWDICFNLISKVILKGAVSRCGFHGPYVDYVPPSSQADVLIKIQCVLQACYDHNYFDHYPCHDADLMPFVVEVTRWVIRQEDTHFGAEVFKLLCTGSLVWPETGRFARQAIESYLSFRNNLVVDGEGVYLEKLRGLL